MRSNTKSDNYYKTFFIYKLFEKYLTKERPFNSNEMKKKLYKQNKLGGNHSFVPFKLSTALPVVISPARLIRVLLLPTNQCGFVLTLAFRFT